MASRDDEARAAGFRSADEHDQHVRAHLDELYAEERAAGRAPSPSQLWAEAHGVHDPEPSLSIAEVARRAGVHHQTVRARRHALAEAGLAEQIGRKWVLKPEAVDALKDYPPEQSASEPTQAKRRRRRSQDAPEGELW